MRLALSALPLGSSRLACAAATQRLDLKQAEPLAEEGGMIGKELEEKQVVPTEASTADEDSLRSSSHENLQLECSGVPEDQEGAEEDRRRDRKSVV